MIGREPMVARINKAEVTRRDPDFAIIGRTKALRSHGRDETLRRAGADILYVTGRNPEDARFLGKRLPSPLLFMTGAGGLAASPLSRAELASLCFRLIVDSTTPFPAIHKALRQCFAVLARASRTRPWTLGLARSRAKSMARSGSRRCSRSSGERRSANSSPVQLRVAFRGRRRGLSR
jgi:2-methylisocitrate lyase-like PEP mutase family enzyme